MNDDFIPGQSSEDSPSDSGDRLASALEELIQLRRSQGGVPVIDSMASNDNADPGCESGSFEPRAGPCPEPGEWALLLDVEALSRELPSVDALLAHAAECRACAGRLRALSADLSPQESALLAQLGCASAEVQRKMAAELAQTPRQSGPRRLPRLYLWTGAGLAASLLIALGLTSWWRISNRPERMLAEAYTNSRIFDLRMPGAGFAEVKPLTHLRGGSDSREPSSLQDARTRIGRDLQAAPGDAHSLQLEARSDILEEKFDPAIDILDRLVAAGPVTASLLLDDASAYFQRGEETGSESDRATALDCLRRADELDPGDAVVLFNEAVVMEERGQLMNAVETWNRYLRLEHDPRWLEEGRRRLQALEQKLNQLNIHSGQP